MPLFSVLDLSPICQGHTAADSFRNTVDLARHAERLGYHRYWLAEHHNIPSVASAATAVLIGHVAAATSRIRVGAGGIMLPNHAPLVIAEQFGTLESLFPGRIDLGIGRAPGGDTATARALRRYAAGADAFPNDLRELIGYFENTDAKVRAIPGAGLHVPIYLLGSSDFSAALAAQMGLPFAFASHFAPDYLMPALALYRAEFQPSRWLDKPHAIVGVNVFAADTDAEARRLMTSIQQMWMNRARGLSTELAPPVDNIDALWSPSEKAYADHTLSVSAVGSPDTIRRQLQRLLELTNADELIITAAIYDHAARLRSYELAAGVLDAISAVPI